MDSFWCNQRVLVTGAAGFLGSAIIEFLLVKDASVTRFVRTEKPNLVSSAKSVHRDVIADISDPLVWDAIIHEVDVIFHLAAQTSVPYAESNAVSDFDVNVRPVIALTEACRRAKVCPTIVFAGTATQFGLTPSLPVNESMPDHPLTIYDLHKCMAETYLKYADRENFVRAATLRLPNLYGPGPESSSAQRGILNRMMRRALNGEILSIYGTGEFVRDYLYIEDTALAFLAAAESINETHGGHFVLGTGKGVTVRDAFTMVSAEAAQMTGRSVDVEFREPSVPLLPIETRHYVANPALFERKSGWRAKVDLATGITNTLATYRSEGAK